MNFNPLIPWLYYSIISTRTNELVFQLISKLALFSGRVLLRPVGTTALADGGSGPTLAWHCITAMECLSYYFCWKRQLYYAAARPSAAMMAPFLVLQSFGNPVVWALQRFSRNCKLYAVLEKYRGEASLMIIEGKRIDTAFQYTPSSIVYVKLSLFCQLQVITE